MIISEMSRKVNGKTTIFRENMSFKVPFLFHKYLNSIRRINTSINKIIIKQTLFFNSCVSNIV